MAIAINMLSLTHLALIVAGMVSRVSFYRFKLQFHVDQQRRAHHQSSVRVHFTEALSSWLATHALRWVLPFIEFLLVLPQPLPFIDSFTSLALGLIVRRLLRVLSFVTLPYIIRRRIHICVHTHLINATVVPALLLDRGPVLSRVQRLLQQEPARHRAAAHQPCATQTLYQLALQVTRIYLPAVSLCQTRHVLLSNFFASAH